MGLARQATKLFFAGTDVLLPTPPGPRILIYHRVGIDLGRQMEVTSEAFVWQLDWIQDNREVVDLDSALRRWHEPGSEHLVVITFDDGYRDTYTRVFPMLRERRVPFTIFLATAAIGSSDRLTWDQVNEMRSTGLVTTGAHTHNHVDLRHCSAEQIEDEIEISNHLVESRTGVRPRHFAYPWGYWGKIADGFVRRAYESAMLGSRPAGGTGRHDQHMIYRYPVQLSDGKRWFRARLNGGLLFEETVRRRLRGYSVPRLCR